MQFDYVLKFITYKVGYIVGETQYKRAKHLKNINDNAKI